MNFNMTKIITEMAKMDLDNMTAYELQAIGKMLSGAGESMIYKELVKETSDKAALANFNNPSKVN